MSILSSIFTTEEMRKSVLRLEHSLISGVEIGFRLMDLMACPDNSLCPDNPSLLTEEYSVNAQRLHRTVREQLLNPKEPASWKGLGFIAHEAAILSARQSFLRELPASDKELVRKSHHGPADIVHLSFRTQDPDVLLVFKQWWIAAKPPDTEMLRSVGLLHWYQMERPRMTVQNIPSQYIGMLPTSAPVRRALVGLWGLDTLDFYLQNDFQHRLAQELDLCPQYVNSVLWVLGERLKLEKLQKSNLSQQTEVIGIERLTSADLKDRVVE